MKIAIFGGTGDLGRGLAINFAAAGHEIVVGSRSQERADQAAEGLRAALPSGTFTPRENVTAAEEGELAIVSIPWEGIDSTIPPMAEALAGKVVISVVNAIKFGKSGAIAEQGEALPAQSCAHRIQELAPEAKVVVAYNNLPAAGLQAQHHLDADVLVCGNPGHARPRRRPPRQRPDHRGLHRPHHQPQPPLRRRGEPLHLRARERLGAPRLAALRVAAHAPLGVRHARRVAHRRHQPRQVVSSLTGRRGGPFSGGGCSSRPM
jgi:NADPH-dependent F420 reductase